MEKYTDDLCLLTDTIMSIIFSAGDESQCDEAFNALHKEISGHYFPESVKTNCLQAIDIWGAAQASVDKTEKLHQQRSAILSLLTAFGRVHALMAIEEYIRQKNTEVFGLR